MDAASTLWSVLDDWRKRDAGAPACQDSMARLDYGGLAARAEALAAALLAAGVRKGDRVAVLAPPANDFLESFLAATSIGALWVGLNPKYSARELHHVLSDAQPAVVLSRATVRGREYAAELAAVVAEACPAAQLMMGGPGATDALLLAPRVDAVTLQAARAAVTAADDALIFYTSGTTGAPKGAVLRHGGLVHTARVQGRVVGLERPRVLNNLPINHIGCVGDLGLYALVSGGSLVFQEAFDAAGVVDLLERARITFWGAIPTMFQLSLQAVDVRERDLSALRVIMWSGAPASPALIRQLRGLAPRLCSSYGMTETVGSVVWAFDADEVTMAETIGWPLPDYEVRLADADGRLVVAGEPGEVQVRGGFVMRGYWQRPEATREAFTADGWLRTGDLAEARADGAFRLVGRLKEMFKSGGYNVYPREVEQVLEACPGVAAAVVVPVADPLYAEVGHAFVLGEADPVQLEAHCRHHLANYKVPKRFTQVEGFPTLPNGKIDKAALRRRAAEWQVPASAGPVAPLS